MEKQKIVGIEEKLPILETIPLSFQHLFAMLGATIIVPLILGVNPAIALLMNGIGTIVYSIITKGKIPAYLGSSFAFIAPATLIIANYGGYQHTQSGFIFFGLFFVLISFVIKYVGTKWIDIVMPPAVMGSVVAVIGLELAPVAANWAGLLPKTGAYTSTDIKVMIVSLFTLAIGIFGTVLFRRFMKVIPILIGVVSGYILSLILGLVSYKPILEAKWFELPKFTAPVFDLNAIAIIAPACIVVLAEHIGHLIVTGNITDHDFIKEPGLDRSLLADGITNIISGFAGSTPNTTYAENIGVMTITKVYSVWVIRGAAIIAIIFSCIGKVSAAIQTIPKPVIGGISMLLYGVIATSGIRMLIENRVDLSKNYNMVLAAVTFIVGVSGATITIGQVKMSGMSLAAVCGMILSCLFYVFGKLKIMNEEYKPNNEE